MPARIGPKKPRRIFLAEWREARGLTQERLADRLGTSHMTISRWELGKVKMNTDAMVAVAEALGLEPEDLWHHPDTPTPNMLLRGASEPVQRQALSVIEALRKAN